MSETPTDQDIAARYCSRVADTYHSPASVGMSDVAVSLSSVYVMLRSARVTERAHLAERLSADTREAGSDGREQAASGMVLPRTDPPVPLGEALRAAPRMALLGKAGAGKTTSLRFIALCFAEGSAQENLGLAETRLPVYLSLRDHA
jgi:hypothetical protein